MTRDSDEDDGTARDGRAGAGVAAAPPAGSARAGDPLGLDGDAEPGGTSPPGGRGGRGLAVLALLLALAGAGAAGYLYYELIYRSENRAADLEGRLETVQASLEERLADARRDLETRLEAQAARQRQALEAFAEGQQAAARAADAALQAALARLARQGPPSSGDWRRAEAQYLLRIANHRLLMERDVAGALQLLRTADATLAALDDFSVHPVRARLADEIAALESVREVDLPGLFLRLEAAKRALGDLPLRVPEHTAAPRPAGAAEPAPQDGVLAELQRQLRGLLRVRRLESDARPLLAPREGLYLELNLRLMLERAQLAAMNRDQLAFEESLASAADWVRRYLQPDDPAVAQLLRELAALRTVSLTQPLPDVSGSLEALEGLERQPHGPPPQGQPPQ